MPQRWTHCSEWFVIQCNSVMVSLTLAVCLPAKEEVQRAVSGGETDMKTHCRAVI